MKMLRYILFLVCFTGFGLTASAQLSIGGGLAFNFNSSYLGINARGVYSFSDEWRGQAGFTYFFAQKNISAYSFNFNGNYVFADNGNGTKFYGLAGLNLVHASAKTVGFFGNVGRVGQTSAGLNLGLGNNLQLGDNLSFFGELKYIISRYDGFDARAGVLYNFD